jgi:serine/threonine protein kinase/Tol biopolymer transport system component
MPDLTARLTAALADRYRIERELGAGGMANVYLAQDLRHDRKVALKVLRPELAAILGGDRFLQEIKTTANLQHPHILPLHDSGEAGGQVFYVMPYIEGESLRDRLNREKQLPVEDAVRIAREVADALQYAHQQGVIHRDIKPENILLHGGHAMVADFGIAFAAVRSEGNSRLTETGMSLGTPNYMSPEQAMGGRELDARADIYALGCVLYEMLSGEPPFTGPTPQAIIARVMTEQPRPLVLQRPTVPPYLDAVVRTALQKLPADRFASAGQMLEALIRPGYPSLTTEQPLPQPVPTAFSARRRSLLPWGLAAAGVTLAVFGWFRPRGDAANAVPSRLAMLTPSLTSSGITALKRQLALTPDGRAVIFTSIGSQGAAQLSRQDLDAAEPRIIPTQVDAGSGGREYGLANFVVSWDGRWLVAEAPNSQVLRFPIEGGTGVRLPLQRSDFAVFDAKGHLWSDAGNDRGEGGYFNRLGAGDSLSRELAGRVGQDQLMQVLPDGHTAIAMVRQSGTSSSPSHLIDLVTGDTLPLMASLAVEVRYTSGLLVSVLVDGTMMAAPFDLKHRRITGSPVTVATGVSTTGSGIAQIAVSPNGTVAYIPEEPRSLVFVDRSGGVRQVLAERHNYHAPMFSPDGRRISTDLSDIEGRDVRVLNIGEQTLTRATFDRDGHDATWTPDGAYLTYTSLKTGKLGIYRTRPGRAEPAESLFASEALGYSGYWLPDGSGLVTVASGLNKESGLDIALLTKGGRGPMELLAASRFTETHPAVSPDGRWLAYVSDQSGNIEVYVRPLGRDGELVQVSRGGGGEPVWAPDGRELFYRGDVDGEPMLIAASVQTAPTLTVTARRPLFPVADMVTGTPHRNYDISPDGKTFVMVQRSPGTRIMVIQNLPVLVARLRGGEGAAR